MIMSQSKRLYRSKTDRQIAGVCGGLANYLQVDATIVRLIFVFLTLMGGPGLLIYIILALVIPEEDAETKAKNVIVDEDGDPI
jgi:phage shock protein C